jgi:drug/metabolite transporter (DMT)-like permease
MKPIKRKKEKSAGGILLPALLCTLLWGSAFPSVKSGYALFGIGEDTFSKLFFAGWRFMLAGVLVLLVYIVLYRKPFLPNRRMWKGILVLGLIQTTLQYVFFYIGLSHTTGVKGSVLTATTTFLSVLISHFLFPDDRLNRYKVIGCILGFEGVILISMGSGDLFTGGFLWNGEGFMILSAAAAAVGAVISKLVTRGAEPMVVTGWQLFFGGAVLLIAGTAGGGHFESVSPHAFALLGYMIFLSATAFTVWTILLKKHPVGKVTVYNFLVPIFGSLLSGLVLGEKVFTGRNMISLLFVCAGIILVNLKSNPVHPENKNLRKQKTRR